MRSSLARRSILAAALAATAVATPAPTQQMLSASQPVAAAAQPAAQPDTSPAKQTPAKALTVTQQKQEMMARGDRLPSRLHSPIWIGYERPRRSWS